MAYPFSKRILAPLLARRIGELRGSEHIPANGPILVVANHVGYQDPVLLVTAFVLHTGRKVHAIAKKKFLRIPFLKRWLGIIPLYHDKSKTLARARKTLEQGQIVLVYPEGTVNFSDALLPTKTGAARLALWTGVPVIPIGIRRTQPPPKTVFKKYVEILTGRIRVYVGKPLVFPKQSEQLTSESIHRTHNKIMTEIALLAQKRYIPIQ